MKKLWGTVNTKSVTKAWRAINFSLSEGPSLPLFQNNDNQLFWHNFRCYSTIIDRLPRQAHTVLSRVQTKQINAK